LSTNGATATIGMTASLEAFRRFFPITEKVAYLNHAAAGPVSTRVIEALDTFLWDRATRGSEAAPDSKALSERTRAKVAEFIGASPDEIAFMKATPDGLNAAANGVRWRAGDNVVTADIEFPANVYPWMNLAELGVELRFAKSHDGIIDPAAIYDLMDDRTRVVALSWVEFHGGFRNDLGAIGAECRSRGVYLAVDAIQGLGALRCDVKTLNVDFLCAASQKWVLGPHGVAPFYVRREILDDIRVAFVGLSGIDQGPSYLDYDLKLRGNASRFEPGYINQVGIAGLEAAIDLFNEAGMDNVEAQVLALSRQLHEGLTQRGYTVYGPSDDAHRSGVVSFRHDTISAGDLVARLREVGVVVSEREGHVRVASHFYNTAEEIDRLLNGLPS
jgi:cysteine desulfurase / selenocysteine lyase